MPAMSDGPVTLTVPFEFSGSFAHGLTGSEVQQTPLTGGGEATLLLQPGFDGTSWIIERVVFEFDPAAGS
jgi:hypothetical protein